MRPVNNSSFQAYPCLLCDHPHTCLPCQSVTSVQSTIVVPPLWSNIYWSTCQELLRSNPNKTSLHHQAHAGDIVYNTTTGLAATVVAPSLVATPDTVELNASIFTGAGDAYVIYQSGAMAGGGSNFGCVLYVGGVGSVRVLTIDQDDVTFFGVQTGTFMPVQVVKVFATGTSATDIVALW